MSDQSHPPGPWTILGLCGIHRCGVSIDRGSDRDRITDIDVDPLDGDDDDDDD